ncbi:Transcriptional regulatory protein DegU [Acaryochloris thomasi RCC1774]|uniref:Transcriptional regulatory protein DegU n=1 Tax=Acaryochloris thomasi RCC1774 TaxID=1764569 RepID=A0A2W1K6U3_9CYAN|nr:response regulator transcription factor [Acaryochloris thomasi]PZD75297.1 Transcriptional regulatory protein DegU [Acaryochloris thomasi RCC1774]
MTTAATPITIMVTEDHGIVRQGIISILERQPDFTIVAEAKDGLEAVALYATHQPDITLMDLRMPNLEGVEAITRIREYSPDARIIILTTYDTDEDIYRGLQAGARGYILKDADFEDLVDAVRTVHKGKRYLPPNVALKLAERMDTEELTEREQDVLNLMVLGTSTPALAKALNISEGTVKFHINHIFQKLGVNDRTQAVIAALRRGLVRLDD